MQRGAPEIESQPGRSHHRCLPPKRGRDAGAERQVGRLRSREGADRRARGGLERAQQINTRRASELSAVAPPVAAAAVTTAAILVPSFTLGMTLAQFADLLTIAGLLILARVAIALAGMDAGSAVGGIGASRTMAAVVLTEPALVLAIFALGLLAGSSNLDLIAAMQHSAMTVKAAANANPALSDARSTTKASTTGAKACMIWNGLAIRPSKRPYPTAPPAW